MTSCFVSWPSSNSLVDVSAEATLFFLLFFSVKYLLFFRRRNSCKWLSCLSTEKCRKNNFPKSTFSWYWCEKALRDCGPNGGYSRKIPNRYYEGQELRLWNFQKGYSRNSISKFQGFIKKGVEFQGIKKNSCGICMGAWFLALDLGISKQQCNTILWNWSFALSKISKVK